MTVLVDTSVWSLAFRRRAKDLNTDEQSVVAELAELIKEGRTRMIGPIRQELLSGVRSAPQFEKLRAALQAFRDEQIQTSDYETAAKTGNQCRTKGLATSSIDALICSLALTHGWSVFATDLDFSRYAKILPLKLHVPRH